nr:hypothetical protein [Pyrinomonadaceae bacterium]
MDLKISHDDFCKAIKNNEITWGVNNLLSLIYVSKFLAVFVFFLLFLLFSFFSLPILYFGYSETPWFLIFLLPVFFASLSGK